MVAAGRHDARSMRARATELDRLLASIRACRFCVETPQRRSHCRTSRVRCCARAARRGLAICSQAPGTRVHASGIPFTDPSGDRLRDWMGVTPPSSTTRPASPSFPWASASPGKMRRVPICRLGPNAQRSGIENSSTRCRSSSSCSPSAPTRSAGISARRPVTALQATMLDWRKHLRRRAARPRILPLPHPSWRNNAWLKRNPWFEEELLPALRREVRALALSACCIASVSTKPEPCFGTKRLSAPRKIIYCSDRD